MPQYGLSQAKGTHLLWARTCSRSSLNLSLRMFWYRNRYTWGYLHEDACHDHWLHNGGHHARRRALTTVSSALELTLPAACALSR